MAVNRTISPLSLVSIMVLSLAAPALGAADQSRAAAQPAADPLALHVLEAPARVEAAEAVEVQLVRVDGVARTEVAWADRPARWFFVRTGGTQENHDSAPVAAAGDGPARAQVQIPIRGVAMVGADLEERIVSVPASALVALARDKAGITGPLTPLEALGDAVVRVRMVESAATLSRAGAPGQEQAMSPAIRKSAQAVEIRPLLDPLSSAIGGDIFVRVYIRGGGLGGGRIAATALRSGAVQRVVLDGHGIGHFAFDEHGPWRLTVRHLTPSTPPSTPDDGESDWTLYSGSLTFHTSEVAGGGQR
jgi:hypothetical protein